MINIGYRRQNKFVFWSSVVVSNHSSDRTILRRLYLTRRSDNKHDQYPSRWVGNTVTSWRKINRVTLQLQCSIWVTDDRTHLPSGPQWYRTIRVKRGGLTMSLTSTPVDQLATVPKPVTSSKYRVLSRLSCNVIWLPHECVGHLGLVETGWPRRGRCCRIERDKSATWQRRPNFFHKQEYIVDLKSSWRVLRYGMVGWAEWGVAGLGEICKSTSYQKIISLYRS